MIKHKFTKGDIRIKKYTLFFLKSLMERIKLLRMMKRSTEKLETYVVETTSDTDLAYFLDGIDLIKKSMELIGAEVKLQSYRFNSEKGEYTYTWNLILR